MRTTDHRSDPRANSGTDSCFAGQCTECFLILAPVIRGQKGEYKDLFEDMLRRGFVTRQGRWTGSAALTDDLKLKRHIKHHIEIVIDRLKVDDKVRPRLAEAVEQALILGEGAVIIAVEEVNSEQGQTDNEQPEGDGGQEAEDGDSKPKGAGKGARQTDLLLSAHYACTHCGKSYEPPSPASCSASIAHTACALAAMA